MISNDRTKKLLHGLCQEKKGGFVGLFGLLHDPIGHFHRPVWLIRQGRVPGSVTWVTCSVTDVPAAVCRPAPPQCSGFTGRVHRADRR
jgi:hypothetical protein